jgi:hypothetical protein
MNDAERLKDLSSQIRSIVELGIKEGPASEEKVMAALQEIEDEIDFIQEAALVRN